MDDYDVSIINLLQQNARITMSEISNQVHLSVPAVSDRLKKLEASGIIEQYTAILNSSLMHKDLTAIMFVSLERPYYSDGFSEFVMIEPEILECNYLTGDFDYALKVVTKNASSLEKLQNRVKSQQGVQKTNTIVVLSVIKKTYSVKP